MGLASFLRKLTAAVFLLVALFMLGAGLYGIAVSTSPPGYAAGIFLLIISIVLFGFVSWVLEASWLRKLISRLQSPSRRPSQRGFSSREGQEYATLESLFLRLQDYPKHRFSDIEKTWIPSAGGVYVIFDRRGVLYIGRSSNVFRRIRFEHYQGQRNSPLRRNLLSEMRLTENQVTDYLTSQCSFQYIVLHDETRQKDFEHYAKIKLKPFINI